MGKVKASKDREEGGDQFVGEGGWIRELIRKGRGTPSSHLSILSLGLFCCYILMGFGSFSFLSHCISGTIQIGKRKKKNGNSHFRGKKETTHTGKNHQMPAQRCTHLFVRVSLPAGTELTQLSIKRYQEGGLGKGQKQGHQKAWWEGNWRDQRVKLQPIASVWLPALQRQGCHELELAEDEPGRQMSTGVLAFRDGFPVWVSGAVTDISFLTDFVVITVITFWYPLLETFIASWVILLIPGNALGPKGLVTCLLRNEWTESRTEFPVLF